MCAHEQRSDTEVVGEIHVCDEWSTNREEADARETARLKVNRIPLHLRILRLSATRVAAMRIALGMQSE